MKNLNEKKAFALVLALGAMAFMVVLIMTLAAVTSMKLRLVEAEKARAQARSSALLGMYFAIGKVQKTFGPDNVISANASILDAVDTKTNATYKNPRLKDVKQPYILGGFKVKYRGDGADKISSKVPWEFQADLREDVEKIGKGEDSKNATWLISSEKPITNPLKNTVNDLNEEVISFGTYRTLEEYPELGYPLAEKDKVKDYKIEAGKIKVDESRSYAWYVSDESQKHKINLTRKDRVLDTARRPEAGEDRVDRSIPQVSFLTSITELTEAKQNAFIKNSYDESEALKFDNILNGGQLELINESWLGWFNKNNQNYTISSMGLPVDVTQGALKQDLTVYLQSKDGLGMDQYPLVRGDFNYDKDYRGMEYYDADGKKSINYRTNMPRFGLLRTWRNLTVESDGSPRAKNLMTDKIKPSQHTIGDVEPVVVSGLGQGVKSDTPQHGLHPVVSSVQMVTKVVIKDKKLAIIFYPLIQLYNPNNVALAREDYIIRVGFPISQDADVGNGAKDAKFSIKYYGSRVFDSKGMSKAGMGRHLKDTNSVEINKPLKDYLWDGMKSTIGMPVVIRDDANIEYSTSGAGLISRCAAAVLYRYKQNLPRDSDAPDAATAEKEMALVYHILPASNIMSRPKNQFSPYIENDECIVRYRDILGTRNNMGIEKPEGSVSRGFPSICFQVRGLGFRPGESVVLCPKTDGLQQLSTEPPQSIGSSNNLLQPVPENNRSADNPSVSGAQDTFTHLFVGDENLSPPLHGFYVYAKNPNGNFFEIDPAAYIGSYIPAGAEGLEICKNQEGENLIFTHWQDIGGNAAFAVAGDMGVGLKATSLGPLGWSDSDPNGGGATNIRYEYFGAPTELYANKKLVQRQDSRFGFEANNSMISTSAASGMFPNKIQRLTSRYAGPTLAVQMRTLTSSMYRFTAATMLYDADNASKYAKRWLYRSDGSGVSGSRVKVPEFSYGFSESYVNFAESPDLVFSNGDGVQGKDPFTGKDSRLKLPFIMGSRNTSDMYGIAMVNADNKNLAVNMAATRDYALMSTDNYNQEAASRSDEGRAVDTSMGPSANGALPFYRVSEFGFSENFYPWLGRGISSRPLMLLNNLRSGNLTFKMDKEMVVGQNLNTPSPALPPSYMLSTPAGEMTTIKTGASRETGSYSRLGLAGSQNMFMGFIPRARNQARYFTYNSYFNKMIYARDFDKKRGMISEFNSVDCDGYTGIPTMTKPILWAENAFDDGNNGFGMSENIETGVLPLFEYPYDDSSLISIGYFRHANLSMFPWQGAQSIGHSYNFPLIDRESIYEQKSYTTFGDASSAASRLPPNGTSDFTWILNHSMWDRFYLSSIPQNKNVDFTAGMRLTNPRNVLVSVPENKEEILKSEEAFKKSASHVMIDGAFNVNSTSYEAWRMLLSSMIGVDYKDGARDKSVNKEGTIVLNPDSAAAPYGPFFQPMISPAERNTVDVNKVGPLANRRPLNEKEIDLLARFIVAEVKKRGPFFGLADFVNRRLLPYKDGDFENNIQGVTGTIDAAIARATNSDEARDPKNRFLNYNLIGDDKKMSGSELPQTKYEIQNVGYVGGSATDSETTLEYKNADSYVIDMGKKKEGPLADHLAQFLYAANGGDVGSVERKPYPRGQTAFKTLKTNEEFAEMCYGIASDQDPDTRRYMKSSKYKGLPGWLTQADLLQVLGPVLTTRGDTFTVRAYGDFVNPITGEVNAKSWCEAVIQRIAEPVEPSDDLVQPENPFGRRFKIVSFRWVSQSEIMNQEASKSN